MNNNDELIEYLNDFVNFDSGISITDNELNRIGKRCLTYMIDGSSICFNESTNIVFDASEKNGMYGLFANFRTDVKDNTTGKIRVANTGACLYEGTNFKELWLVWKSFNKTLFSHNSSISAAKASLDSESKDTK